MTLIRSAQEIWETALGQLEIQVTKPFYDTWLRGTVGMSFDDSSFMVGVSSPFVAESLQTRFLSLVKKAVADIIGEEVSLDFRVASQHPADVPRVQPSSTFESNGSSRRNGASLVRLNNKYTFDTFITGASNQLACAAARAVAGSPGIAYNPLFIYGGAGLGKTHLLHAIGQVAVTKGCRVLCVSAEQFTNEFINAIRERSTEHFRQKYRGADVLLIDDIQFISGKEQTEEGFFHTFNDLHNLNRQIVLTSDRPPKALTLLEDRLRSRFEWGLLADIQPPELETRIAILQGKATSLRVELSQETLQFIARRYQRNIRELEGALNRVIAFSNLTRSPISNELAALALEDISTSATSHQPITPEMIVDTVSSFFHIPTEALKSRKRDAKTALSRQIAMYLIRDELHRPLADIGTSLGGKDHSTVLYACEKIEEEINVNPQLRRQVLDIRAQLHPDEQT